MIIDNTAILHFSYGISIENYEDKNFTCPQVWFEALDEVAVEAAEVALRRGGPRRPPGFCTFASWVGPRSEHYTVSQGMFCKPNWNFHKICQSCYMD